MRARRERQPSRGIGSPAIALPAFALACALAMNGSAPAAAQNAPVAAASTLPTIGHTHAKGFCDTVRDNVAPTVLGLMKTDELIGASHRAIAKMAHDQTTASHQALELDRVYMDKVVAAMANNVKMMDKLLSDSNRFPKIAHSDDDRFAQLLQEQLRAARDAQNATLNQINGTIETGRLNESAGEITGGPISGALAKNQGDPEWVTPAGNNGSGFLGASALAGPGPIPEPRDLALSNNLSGHTIWDLLGAAVEIDQARIARAEQIVTPTVVAAATGCQTTTPAASPVP